MVSELRRAGLWLAALLVLLAAAPSAAAEGRWPDSAGSLTEETPLYEDYALGNYAADAIRAVGKTELALIGNGAVRTAADGGEFSLVRGTITEEQLRGFLEISFACVRTDSRTESVISAPEELDGFLQISGFRCSYDAAAPALQRLMTLETFDGDALGDGPFSVTAPAGLLEGAGIDEEPLAAGFRESADAFYETWAAGDAPVEHRIRILGTVDGSLISLFPPWARIVLPLLACGLIGQALLRNRRWRDAHGVFLRRR